MVEREGVVLNPKSLTASRHAGHAGLAFTSGFLSTALRPRLLNGAPAARQYPGEGEFADGEDNRTQRDRL